MVSYDIQSRETRMVGFGVHASNNAGVWMDDSRMEQAAHLA